MTRLQGFASAVLQNGGTLCAWAAKKAWKWSRRNAHPCIWNIEWYPTQRLEAAKETDTLWRQRGQDFLLSHLTDICRFRLSVSANGLQLSVKQPSQSNSITCSRSIFQGYREPSAESLGCVNFKLVIFKSQDKMLWSCCNRLPDTWANCGALPRTLGLTKVLLGNGSCSF